jgi:hypothetical protein
MFHFQNTTVAIGATASAETSRMWIIKIDMIGMTSDIRIRANFRPTCGSEAAHAAAKSMRMSAVSNGMKVLNLKVRARL